MIERLKSFFLKYLRKACFSSARYLRAVWRFNSLNSLFELMSLYFPLLDLLSVPIFLIGFFCFFLTFTSAFAATFIALEKKKIFGKLIRYREIFLRIKKIWFFSFRGSDYFRFEIYFLKNIYLAWVSKVRSIVNNWSFRIIIIFFFF
jgi:hypothetical protein